MEKEEELRDGAEEEEAPMPLFAIEGEEEEEELPAETAAGAWQASKMFSFTEAFIIQGVCSINATLAPLGRM